jgi:RimJ/RimL family protein N-acetyltransferase
MRDEQTKMVHVGYCIGKAWWHKGYTSEAFIRLVRFFFEDVGVNRIESRHDPRNPNSGKVMQKAGLRYEGTTLESDWNNQGICDAAHYALLARDYFRKPQPAAEVKPLYRGADETDIEPVTDLLCELYGMERRDELFDENKTHFADERQGFFLALAGNKPIGIAHASLRSDYVNGTELGGTCGYLEAVYVKPEYRLNGIALSLVRLCEKWAQNRGCREFASDCQLHNTESYRFHLRIGFAETERCIFFRKDIGNEEY